MLPTRLLSPYTYPKSKYSDKIPSPQSTDSTQSLEQIANIERTDVGNEFSFDTDRIVQKHPEYNTARVGNSDFEKKLIRKLTDKPNNTLFHWVASFADKLSFCHYTEVREDGIGLVDKLLDFPDDSPLAMAVMDYLQELVWMDWILKGTFDKFDYINIQNRKESYFTPIPKKQGYANAQILIDYVHQVFNSTQKTSVIFSLLEARLHSQYGHEASLKMKEYIDESSVSISKTSVAALLYSTGYIKAFERCQC